MRKLRRKNEFWAKTLRLLLVFVLIFNTLFLGVSVEKVAADTYTKTFVFASTTESFAFTSGGKSTGAFDGTNGNTAGSLQHDSLGRNNLDTSYWEWTGTWEDLGVPAGATVTQIRLNGTDSRVFAWNVVDSATIGPYEIWNNEATPALMATLWSGRSPTGTEGTWTSTGAQTDQSVSATYQASTSTIRFRLYGTIDNGNNAAAQTTFNHDNVSFVATYTAVATTFTQNAYRWYVDPAVESEDVGTDAWGNPDIAQNTAITVTPPSNDPPDSTQELRLRVNSTVNSTNLVTSDKAFKLQFKAGTDGSCTTGSWTDVGASQAWDYATSTVTDGTDLTVSRISPVSDVLEEYIKSSPTGTNPNSATVGQEIEYDFHIVGGTGFADATQYSFRVVESTGTVFDAYTNCPTLSTEPGMADLMRHGASLNTGVEHGFWWVD